MQAALSLLANKTYRLLITVNAVGAFGFWFQATVLTWVVYALTNSAAQVGLIALFQWGPYAVLGLFSVGVADTYGKRKILLLTQIGYASNSLALCFLALTENLTVFAIFASCVWRSLLMCIEQPARQSLIPAIVATEDLTKMLGFTASLSGLGRIVAPSVAGVIIGSLGIRYCFIPNVFTSSINLVGLYFLTVALPPRSRKKFDPVANLREGLRIVAGQRHIAALLIVLLCVTTLPLSFNVILPVFAETALGGGATTFGTLMSCMGVGAVIASLIISSRGMTVNSTLGCAIGVGLVQAALYFQTQFAPVAALMAVVGGCAVGLIVGTNAIILTRTESAEHGRVGGLFSYIVNAIGPMGSVVMGFIVAGGGAHAGLALGATIAITAGAIAMLAVHRMDGPDDGSLG
jgi:MFS family permease